MESVLTMQMDGAFMQGGAESGIQPLPFPIRRYTENNWGRYFVYTPDGKSHPVEAKTAAEAFKVSGVERASRIVRVSDIKHDVLPKGALDGVMADAVTAVEAAPSAMPEAVEPSPASAVATEAMPAVAAAGAAAPVLPVPDVAAEKSSPPRDINTRERLLAGSDFGAKPKNQVESIIEDTIAQSKAEAAPPGKTLSEEEVKKLLGE